MKFWKDVRNSLYYWHLRVKHILISYKISVKDTKRPGTKEAPNLFRNFNFVLTINVCIQIYSP